MGIEWSKNKSDSRIEETSVEVSIMAHGMVGVTAIGQTTINNKENSMEVGMVLEWNKPIHQLLFVTNVGRLAISPTATTTYLSMSSQKTDRDCFPQLIRPPDSKRTPGRLSSHLAHILAIVRSYP